jgi:hypothetical protein
MIGCVDLGVARITEIIKKYGSEVFTRTCENLMDYAERRMRAELASFPDGKYGFQDVIENDGIEARPYTVAIDIYVQGDEVVADYSRSSPQAKGPIDHDEYFACYDLMSGAWGGRFGHDGNDCVNDYEGIRGNEEFLDDLTLMYFAGVDPASADLVSLEMVPLQIRRFQLVRASSRDTDWLLQTLDQQSRRFGARVNLKPDGRLALSWRHD